MYFTLQNTLVVTTHFCTILFVITVSHQPPGLSTSWMFLWLHSERSETNHASHTINICSWPSGCFSPQHWWEWLSCKQTSILTSLTLGESHSGREVTAEELWAFFEFYILIDLFINIEAQTLDYTINWWQDVLPEIGSPLSGCFSISLTMVHTHHPTMIIPTRSPPPYQLW